jgi:hypothetical protein
VREYPWDDRGVPEPAGDINEAVRDFVRSPVPGDDAPPSEPWVPEVTDAEESTVIDVVLDADPELEYFDPPIEGSYVVLDLVDGARAVGWELGTPTPGGRLQLPEDITEHVRNSDRVHLTGRWAHVRLDPSIPPDDPYGYPQPGRMFVVDEWERTGKLPNA